MELKIATLIENNPDNEGFLLNEYGLSLYIEAYEKKILFDTGQSGSFIENAKKMNIDLSKLDYVILSHGHYDHTGGFKKLIENFGINFNIFVGQGFFEEKYILNSHGVHKYIGNSFDEEYINEKGILVRRIKDDITYINDNIMLFSNFTRKNNFELPNNRFIVKHGSDYMLDSFSDEIVLGIKFKNQLIIVLGCSHIGVVNIIKTIMERTKLPIYGVVGGTHLIEADEFRLEKTISFFREKNIKIIGVSHCTGNTAIEAIKHELKNEFVFNNTGNIININ